MLALSISRSQTSSAEEKNAFLFFHFIHSAKEKQQPFGCKVQECLQYLRIMKDAISKTVKKSSSDKNYGKTAGIFQYFVTFLQQKILCMYN